MTEELWDEHHLKILSTVVPVTQQRTCVDPRGTFSLGYTAVGSPFIVHQVLRLCCRTETGENKKLGKSLKAMEPTWIWKMDPSRKTSGKNKKQKKNREDKVENNRLDKIRMKKKIQLEKNIIKWITLRPELKHWKLESLQKTVTLTPRGVSDAGPWGRFAGRGRTRRQRWGCSQSSLRRPSSAPSPSTPAKLASAQSLGEEQGSWPSFCPGGHWKQCVTVKRIQTCKSGDLVLDSLLLLSSSMTLGEALSSGSAGSYRVKWPYWPMWTLWPLFALNFNKPGQRRRK